MEKRQLFHVKNICKNVKNAHVLNERNVDYLDTG